jgi:integrase
MALYKRNGIFHCVFSVNGQGYRQTLETADRREAIQRERDLISRAKEGKLASGMTAEFSRMVFGAALERYLKERAAMCGEADKPKQSKSWDRYVTEPLRPFFAAKQLNQITADDIRLHQAHRLGQGKHPNTVNHEVKALMRVLRRAKLLSRIRDDIRLLPVKRKLRQMSSAGEKQHLFETAAIKPEWQTAHCAALLTANTSMRPVELKRFLWQDLDPVNRFVTLRRSKTEAGTRVIPLNDEAWAAVAALKQRADALGIYAPEYYIFRRQWPKIDATRPISGWRSAWRSLRKTAGMPKLRYYDLRHQFVTELNEAGVPEGVIRELAGNVDPQMMRIYSHPRLAAKRAAVEALATVRQATPATQTGQFEGGYVTNRVTKQLPGHVEAS